MASYGDLLWTSSRQIRIYFLELIIIIPLKCPYIYFFEIYVVLFSFDEILVQLNSKVKLNVKRRINMDFV